MLIIKKCDGTESSFEVRRFEYVSALSSPYGVTLEIVDINDSFAEASPLLRPASLHYVQSNGQDGIISGLITAIGTQPDPVKLQTLYILTLEPYLALLRHERLFKVHHQKSSLEKAQGLIQDLARTYRLSTYADFQLSLPWLTEAWPTHDVQAEDHHLDYFDKLMAFARYYFEQTASGEKLQVRDRPMQLPTRQQHIINDPTRKEDLKDGTPSVYVFERHEEAQNLEAQPVYFDPRDPSGALNSLKTNHPLVFETPVYAPQESYDFIQKKMTEQLSSSILTYAFKGYFSDLCVGERVNFVSPSGSMLEAFIESIKIIGYYQNQAWRFDVEGIARPYDPNGDWLGAYQPRKPLPPIVKGAILQSIGQVNDEGQYQVKFPKGFDVGEITPTISVREIQETVTQDGGASHAVSGTSDVVLVTQDGLPQELLLMGSLIDNKRTSHIIHENYREAGVQMKGGLKVHMRRQDGEDTHGELGTRLTDSQGNPTHLTLGANSQTLAEEGKRAHGIRIESTRQAMTLTSGNHFTSVGDVNYPIHQTALVKVEGEEDQAAANPNKGMKISNTGINTLKAMESVKHYYYNDQATKDDPDPANGNCTVGLGHLVHTGPCGILLNQPISANDVDTLASQDLEKFENIVIQNVNHVKLSQAKFDALVCFVFNTGITVPLHNINNGANDETMVNELLKYDSVYNKKTNKKETEGGILKRSEWEAVAFGYTGPFYENLNPPIPTWG
jgi:GH24 family phage-related lysozyme (muramidase)